MIQTYTAMSFTPPVSRGGFAYAINSFYAETSNKSQYRRATVPELEALFRPVQASRTQEKEPVGHWYEAQLMHYGLAPSKNKAVAKSRLLDAVNNGSLVVPPNIQKLEQDLKKEWSREDKKMKKEAQGQKGKSVAKEAGRAKETPEVKAKSTTKARAVPKDKPAPKAKVVVEMKSSVKKTFGDSNSVTAAKRARDDREIKGEPAKRTKQTTGSSEIPAPRMKQTARCSRGRGSAVSGRSRGGGVVRQSSEAAPAFNPAAPRMKQTARRSGGWIRGRPIHMDPGQIQAYEWTRVADEDGYHDEEEEDDDDDSFESSMRDEDSDAIKEESSDGYDQCSRLTLGRLGFINGEYEIYSDDLNEWSDMYNEEDFNLILCLQGDVLWGAYDFGMHSGILRLPARPKQSSLELHPFSWRGRENGEGEVSFNDECNYGWIQFLGDGKIEGMINCYGEVKFTGQRISGDETRPPRTWTDMQTEWRGYNEDNYERERVSRWR